MDSSIKRRIGLQARIEASSAGRILISLILLATLAAIGVENMPNSVTKARLLGLAQPYLNATGLDQNWGVFAPNPRDVVVYVRGRVDYTDGGSTTWSIPTRPNLWAYSDYRWQKFGEYVHFDANGWTWLPLAQYIANQARHDGHKPMRVTLMRRWYELLPPGPGPDHGPWNEEPFFILDLERSA
jgi:hypothetical protein